MTTYSYDLGDWRRVRLATAEAKIAAGEAGVEGKMRDSGCQLSLRNTVPDCAMKMRRELIHPSQADQCRDSYKAAISL